MALIRDHVMAVLSISYNVMYYNVVQKNLFEACTSIQKQHLSESVGPTSEVCEDDCIKYIVTLDDGREGFFVPEVAMETKKQ